MEDPDRNYTTWIPDTHPHYTFRFSHPKDDINDVRCDQGWYRGFPVNNPQELYTKIISENNMAGDALRVIEPLLPRRLFKQVLDEDNDPVGDEVVIKIKHKPIFTYGDADGHIDVQIPGPHNMTEEEIAVIKAALYETFEDTVTLID